MCVSGLRVSTRGVLCVFNPPPIKVFLLFKIYGQCSYFGFIRLCVCVCVFILLVGLDPAKTSPGLVVLMVTGSNTAKLVFCGPG